MNQQNITIQDLKDNFTTPVEGIEFLALLAGVKPCNRVGLYPHAEERSLAFFHKHGLHYVASDFRIRVEDDAPFANKASIITNSDEPGITLWYVSADDEIVAQTKRAEAEKDHITLGENLGYPACCTKFFLDNVPTRPDQDFTIPVIEAADDTVYPFVNNVLRRDDFITLIFHFPCSFGCQASEKIGRRVLEMLQQFDADAASKIRAELCQTVDIRNKQIHFGES